MVVLKGVLEWLGKSYNLSNNDRHEKHIIDNRAKLSKNPDGFLRSLVKALKIKFLHLMRRSMRMLSFKMRNLKRVEK